MSSTSSSKETSKDAVIMELKMKIVAVETRMKKQEKQEIMDDDGLESLDDDNDAMSKVKSNRGHSALTRQVKRKKE